ncbi:MAG: protein kinase family protein [Actinomycetota bacterium]|nr:protein kinase family protein [Actinomycetota bacterium]
MGVSGQEDTYAQRDDADDEDGVHAQTLSAGMQLAGRYQIEDLVGETHRAQMWRAEDDVLNRSVSVQVIGGPDPASETFLVAARRATAVEDPRFLRVLDAARENDYAYVVREWASGVSLDNVLRAGPLSAVRSISVVREVAEAVAAAHRAGVQHRRIDPARILITDGGAIRLLGLATDQALHAPDDDVEGLSDLGERSDVTALGSLLYACLVARWPSQRDGSLPAAPTEHGRLLRPRQVRAGVDPATDAVCDRILDIGTRHGDDGLRTADEVARELGVLVPLDETTGSFAPPAGEDDETIPRGVIPVVPAANGPPPAVNRVPPPRTKQRTPAASVPATPRRRTGARLLVWAAIVLLAGLVAVFALLVLPAGVPGPGGGGTGADSRAAPAAGSRNLSIADVQDFDPLGNGSENPDTVANTFDGDPDTAWTTVGYYSELNLQKAGVGLRVDLGEAQEVSKVDLRLVGRPSSIEVYAAPAGNSTPPESVGDLELLGESKRAGTTVSLPVRPTFETQYLVVWLTAIPEVEAGTRRGSVAEITVRG